MMKRFRNGVFFWTAIGFHSVMMAAGVTSQLDENRILLFDDYYLTNNLPVPTWQHEGPSLAAGAAAGFLPHSNHYHRTGWVLLNCRIGQRTVANSGYVPPQMATNYISSVLTTNYSANMMNTLNATIYSPIFTNGIGTLYFEAINCLYANVQYNPEFVVEIATNMTNGTQLSGDMTDPGVNWQPAFSTTLTDHTATGFIRVMEDLQIRQPVAFRIRRTNTNTVALENFYICIDNIRVSPMAPDVVLSSIDVAVAGAGSFVACDISNASGAADLTDHTSRDVQLWYRWFSSSDTSAWAQVAMVYQPLTGAGGDGERWKTGAMSFVPDCALEYYFIVSGDPVYQSPDYTETGYVYDPEAGARYPQSGTFRYTQVTVSFDSQGGTATVPPSRTVIFEEQYGILPTTSRTGHTFNGWYTAPGGQGMLITWASNVTIIANHTLYAGWTPNTYTVTFDPQGGNVSPSTMAVTYDATYGPLPVPTFSGFLFAGWFTVAGGGGTRVTENTPVAITAAQTLYAHWVSNTDWYWTNSVAVTYILTTPEELSGFSTLVNLGVYFNGRTVILGADIDMSSLVPWTPIGTNEAAMFLGTFDGKGRVISGLTTALASSDNVGLFGVLGPGAVVRNVNLTLTGCTITGNKNVGGLAGYNFSDGYNYGIIQNCQVLDGTITGSENVGGLVGWNGGIVRNGFSTATVNTGSPRGGVAGRNTGGIQNSYWLTGSSSGAVGDPSGGTTNDVYVITGYPGTLGGTAFDTDVLSKALNAWVQAQNGPFYWWTDGTGSSHPVLTLFAPPQVTMELGENRILLFDDYYLTNNLPVPTWQHEGPSLATGTAAGFLPHSNHYHRTGWVLLNCRIGQRTVANSGYVPPQMATNYISSVLTTNYSANMMNTLNAAIYSPVFTDGIGTLYFEAINSVYANTQYNPEFVVEIATNMTNGTQLSGNMTDPGVNWQPAFSTTLTDHTATGFIRVREQLQIRQPVAFRIRRINTNTPSFENFYICIDNIRVSFPPADVVLSKPLAPFDIGYPSVNTPGGQMLCQIDNMPGPYLTSYPGGTRTNVQVVTRWNYIPGTPNPPAGWVTPWQTNTLACVHTGNGLGEGELWEGVFAPYADAGSLEYYFLAAYNGAHYQSPDYTGEGYYYPPETTSPKLYSDGVSVGTPFRFNIRLYPATFGEVTAVTDQFGEFPMYQTGTNEWQARVEVVGTTVSNITWYFKGTGEYQGNYTYSEDTVYWCNQTGIRHGTLPYGDNCLRTTNSVWAMSVTNRLEVQVVPTESNYVLLTLNTASTNFMAGRGEYQDFNAWEGADNYFTHTLDKYPKTTYAQDFNLWPTTSSRSISNHWGGVTNLFTVNVPYPNLTSDADATWCEMGSFEYVRERTPVNTPPETVTGAQYNQALRLFGGSQYLGLGYFQGNAQQISEQYGTRGIGTVSFRGRLSRLVKNNDSYCFEPAIYTQGYTLSNYVARVYLSVRDLSPESPSVSVILYYQSPYAFYEYRVTQIPDPRSINGNDIFMNNDACLRHELYKWQNRVPTRLDGVDKVGDALIGGSNPSFIFYAVNDSSGSVRFRCDYPDNTTQILSYTDTNPVSRFGTFGILSSECNIELTDLLIRRTVTSGSTGVAEDTSLTLLGRPPNADWALSPIYQTAPLGFRTRTLSNQIKVLLRDPLSASWTEYNRVTITNFEYQAFTANVNEWQSKYLRLEVAGVLPGTGAVSSDIALDGVVVSSWRAVTSETTEPILINRWKAVNAVVTTNATPPPLRVVRMDASQASPATAQSVQSPRIMGIGAISFDYRVLNAPAQLKIQYSRDSSAVDDSLSPNNWVDLGPESIIPCGTSGGWQTFSQYYGTFSTTNLFLRILNDRSDINSNAVVEISNVTIINNPTNSPNDWVAYNAKITGLETNRWWIDAEKSLFLNNHQTDGTDMVLSDFDPCVMSPKLTKGLGRISFLARAYDPAVAVSGDPVTVSVMATTNAWGVNITDSNWEDIGSVTLHTNAFYRPYSISPTNGINRYATVKLVIKNGKFNAPEACRVCLDEILVSEQIYPKFDISNVRLLQADGTPTQQPMEGQDIGVEAQLTNVLLDPTNIVVKLYYVTGTNTWGVFSGAVEREMVLVDPQHRIYRTAEPTITGGIEEQFRNTVVQYKVMATYQEAGKADVYTVEQEMNMFTNPSWYYPVDLNRQFGATPDRWSPYYIAYDVPPGAVWINEINRIDTNGIYKLPYIEVVVPAWMDLDGWSFDCLTGSTTTPTVVNLTIHSSALSGNVDATSGYAFYVIGTSDLGSITDYVLSQTELESHMPYMAPGALRLKRPTGIHEQTVVYDWWPTVIITPNGAGWANNMTNGVARYIGFDDNDGSLSFTGTVAVSESLYLREDSTNTWVDGNANYNWTPGAPNIGQVLPPAPPPSGLNVLITSVMNSANGTQNGLPGGPVPLLIKVRKNESTNIVYTANDWYRLYSVTANGVETLPQSPTNQFTLHLNNLQSSVTVSATLDLREDVLGDDYPPDFETWLRQFDDLPLAPTYLNQLLTGRQLTLRERFWINANPTTTNLFTLKMADKPEREDVPDTLNPSNTSKMLYLTLEMALNSNRIERLQGAYMRAGQNGQPDYLVTPVLKAQTTFSLAPINWILISQYMLGDDTFDADNRSRVQLHEFLYDRAFFKWSLELNDPRSSVFEMRNSPKD